MKRQLKNPKIQASQHKLRNSKKEKSFCLILRSLQYSLNQKVSLNFMRYARVLQKLTHILQKIATSTIPLIVFS